MCATYSYALIERLYTHSLLTYAVFCEARKCYGRCGNRLVRLLAGTLMNILSNEGEAEVKYDEVKDLVSDAVKIALILHDVGKASTKYQLVINRPYAKFSFKYHELLSSYITYKFLINALAELKAPKRLKDYILYSVPYAVLTHHEALRNLSIYQMRWHEAYKFLGNANDFLMDDIEILSNALGSILKKLKSRYLIETIDEVKTCRYFGSELSNFIKVLERGMNDLWSDYLGVILSSTTQLCDRVAAKITRSQDPLRSLTRLELEFINYCFGFEEFRRAVEGYYFISEYVLRYSRRSG